MPRFETLTNLNIRSGPGINYEIWDTLQKGDVVEETIVTGWCPVPMEDGTIGWMSRAFLKPAPDIPDVPVTVPSGEPIWLRWARSKIGVKEVPGPGDNPEIAAWYKLTTLEPQDWHDSTAWCSVFVNAAFVLNNLKGTNNALAVSWLKWGLAVKQPQKGDVVVFEWWQNGKVIGHHVAFYMRDLGSGMIECLGGNQQDAVNITSFPAGAVMGYRRAA